MKNAFEKRMIDETILFRSVSPVTDTAVDDTRRTQYTVYAAKGRFSGITSVFYTWRVYVTNCSVFETIDFEHILFILSITYSGRHRFLNETSTRMFQINL